MNRASLDRELLEVLYREKSRSEVLFGKSALGILKNSWEDMCAGVTF